MYGLSRDTDLSGMTDMCLTLVCFGQHQTQLRFISTRWLDHASISIEGDSAPLGSTAVQRGSPSTVLIVSMPDRANSGQLVQ